MVQLLGVAKAQVLEELPTKEKDQLLELAGPRHQHSETTAGKF
ncbi:hypothetical protein MAR_021159 [Mya arenaria]|uniref:Uncharacterized protein n=1 Tax=Mya arenaria TaxID=6604 RepID=A0ABY7E7E8_MYAAR|nr:hypothetical protein MAR_021159 [Mya arenaria]